MPFSSALPDSGASPSALRGAEPSIRKLIEHMPIALWQVDGSVAGRCLDQLQVEGVTDIKAYLTHHPEVLEYVMGNVVVTAVNRQAMRLFGCCDEAAFLQPVHYLFEDAPCAAARVMIAHFEGRRTHVEEIKVKVFDGRILDVLVLVTFPGRTESQETTFICMLDITDRIRVEHELRQLQADFAHAARVSTLGELVASIAHEVRQPLAAIVMNGETSLRWLSREDPDIAKVVRLTGKMVSSASHASAIIERIQNMAKKQEPLWAPLAVNDIVDDALLFVRHEGRGRQIEFILDLDRGVADVLGDRIQLQQVVVNLLVNAMQAIEQAGAVRRHVVLRTMQEEGNVLLSIRDSGPGILNADLEHVFTGFFTTRVGGMGMGLTICKSIIISHGGTIEVSNHPDGGACFTVRIPSNVQGTPEPTVRPVGTSILSRLGSLVRNEGGLT